jgi:hypothetical protein
MDSVYEGNFSRSVLGGGQITSTKVTHAILERDGAERIGPSVVSAGALAFWQADFTLAGHAFVV